MTANELTTGAHGIFNRNDLRSSPPGDVKRYKLTEEERLQLIEKYGPYTKGQGRNKNTIHRW